MCLPHAQGWPPVCLPPADGRGARVFSRHDS
jgi:hypothetical protein